jgi:hypothetical protein
MVNYAHEALTLASSNWLYLYAEHCGKVVGNCDAIIFISRGIISVSFCPLLVTADISLFSEPWEEKTYINY